MTRSRLQRWAPIWSLALRANRLLKAERKAHRQTRHDLAVASAKAQNAEEEYVDAAVRCRRLELQLAFVVDKAIESAEGAGAWMDGERPA